MELLNMSSLNFTNNTTDHSFSSTSGDVAPVVVLSLCFLVGFPGNLAVIIFKPNWQNLSRLSQCLMMNLALSDLLCLSTVPFWIYELVYGWTFGTGACKFAGYVAYCSVQSSVLTTTALSVQRYMQVIHQQRCLQFKKRLLVLLWLTSMLLSVPALVFRQMIKYHQTFRCDHIYTSEAQQVAVLLIECFLGFSAFTVTSCAYIFLNKKLNQAAFFNNASTSRLVTSLIVTFFVLWMPYVVFNLVTVGGILSKNKTIIDFYSFGFDIFASITFINSCINPLLYAFALRMCRKKTVLNSNSRDLTSVVDE